jgi:hypothetical protein
MSKTPPSLFRPAALAAASHWHGKIVLAHPLSMRVAAGAALALTLAWGVLLACGSYTRTVRVAGQLIPSAGSIRVVAPGFARIARQLVPDDAHVAAGQVLFDLSAERDNDAHIDRLQMDRRRALAAEIATREQEGASPPRRASAARRRKTTAGAPDKAPGTPSPAVATRGPSPVAGPAATVRMASRPPSRRRAIPVRSRFRRLTPLPSPAAPSPMVLAAALAAMAARLPRPARARPI